jgi:UDP-3-O-[3-hydroxymyristoyl] glucosamine N-acyltransferase
LARRSRSDRPLGLAELAALVAGEVHGAADVRLTGVAEIARATAAELVFVADKRRVDALAASEARVALVPAGLAAAAHAQHGLVTVGVADPHAAVARVLEYFHPLVPGGEGVHPTAFVAATAILAADVVVGPGAMIDDGAQLGDRTEIGAGCYVGPGVVVGCDTLLHPNVTLYQGSTLGDRVLLHSGVVIGADGFGFARGAGTQRKVPQVGGVQLGDDVEIGANSCVDRGTLSDTVVGAGTKIDNLVQIGHNCRIGRNCALSALTGLAGSTVVGDGVIMGGNVGTAGHQTIGDGSMLAAKSGVHGDLPAGSVVAGAPQMDIRVWRRSVSALAKLPDLVRRVRHMERRLGESPKE